MKMSKINQAVREAFDRGYRVNGEGELILLDGSISKAVCCDKDGYRTMAVKMKRSCNGIRFGIHKLQAYQKYGQKLFQSGMEVRHLDGNKTNNTPKNIAIGSRRDNVLDIPEDKRKQMGQAGAASTRNFSNKTAYLIFEDRAKGMKERELAAKYGGSLGSIHHLLKLAVYSTELREKFKGRVSWPCRLFSPERVLQIARDRQKGLTYSQLQLRYGKGRKTLRRIINQFVSLAEAYV